MSKEIPCFFRRLIGREHMHFLWISFLSLLSLSSPIYFGIIGIIRTFLICKTALTPPPLKPYSWHFASQIRTHFFLTIAIYFSFCFPQGKGTVKSYWLVDFATRTPRRNRRSFRRLKGPMDQSSGFLGILEAPPSPCRLSRTSSLRRTMKAIQPEPQVTKGRFAVDVNDKLDDTALTSV